MSPSESKRAKYRNAREHEVTASLSLFRLTDEKYCIFFSPKACDTQKVLKRRLRPGLHPGFGRESSGYPSRLGRGHLPNFHPSTPSVSQYRRLPCLLLNPSNFFCIWPRSYRSVAPYRLNNLCCVYDNYGTFFIVDCIILHSILITHLRNCNLLVGNVTLLKFSLNMYFAERYVRSFRAR